jgi:hypothetical protein
MRGVFYATIPVTLTQGTEARAAVCLGRVAWPEAMHRVQAERDGAQHGDRQGRFAPTLIGDA